MHLYTGIYSYSVTKENTVMSLEDYDTSYTHIQVPSPIQVMNVHTRKACLNASESVVEELILPACRVDCRDDCKTVYACKETFTGY